MIKYIIVYESYTSFYNEYTSSDVKHKGLSNYEVEASSKKEAYDKFKEYTKEEKRKAALNTNHKHLYKEFTILNIIDLEG